MVTRLRYLVDQFESRVRSANLSRSLPFWKEQWIGPLVLAILITVIHFSIAPKHMFWHDLLRRAYYFPIVWVVYQSGLRGGAISSLAISSIFVVHLLTGWGHHLGSQMDQVYDIVGYLAVGFGVGFVVDRARMAAVAVAQREWDVSLRGVISATIHELKKPKTDIRKLANDLSRQYGEGTWEYSLGLRLSRATDRIDELRRDLTGIAKILSSRTIVTKPLEWAQTFSQSRHLGGGFGMMVAKADTANPPPAIWPISSSILDEVTRCLLEDMEAAGQLAGKLDLTVSGRDGALVIECSTLVRPQVNDDLQQCQRPMRGWVRMKLMELTWGRYNGQVHRFDTQHRVGFRLKLVKPRISPRHKPMHPKRPRPSRRIQESYHSPTRRTLLSLTTSVQ
jgi:hypothetical protein